ncbi:MAG: CehA/McbA family metallohydrolase [Acidobacteria bacterium]|nr:CehA/McbA family metallohydrolase [Acidobacteriota bacterium]
MRRAILILPFVFLLGVAIRSPRTVAGQGAVSHSLTGHEEMTFWTHRRGLEQLDFSGEVGFGDMARLLLRRRENTYRLTELRDRFTFRTVNMAKLSTPDVFRLRVTDRGLVWLNRPERYVAFAGRVLNVPMIIENATANEATVDAALEANRHTVKVAAGKSSGLLFKWVERTPSPARALLEVKHKDSTLNALVHMDNRPPARLRVKIVDENGQPSAARVYVTGADGLSYVPKGSVPRITAMSAEYFFHSGGTFQMEMPAGFTRIEATRGLEYELASAEVSLQRDNDEEITLRLKRWSDMSRDGWWSSDSHIHMNYTAPHHQVMTPEDMRLLTLGEDLHVPNFLVANSGGEFIHDEQYFEAKPHALSDARHILYWNEEFRNSGPYGHIAFYGLKSLVRPFYTGFRNTPYPDDYPANYAAAKAGKDQGAAVLYVHPGMSSGYDSVLGGAGAKELPVDLALGVIDAMDVVSNNDEQAGMELWYKLLNCGFRLGISAGTDSFVNVTDHYLPGGHRVFVKTPNGLRYGDWVENYKRGRSFATNGPVVMIDVEGKGPGEELALAAGPRKVKVTARVRTAVPLDSFAIVVNGVAVAAQRNLEGGEQTLTAEVPLTASSWIAARAMGPRHRLVLNDPGAFAHTSPVYVTVGGRKVLIREDARYFVGWIDRLKENTDRRGRFSKPEQKREVMELFERARKVFLALAG